MYLITLCSIATTQYKSTTAPGHSDNSANISFVGPFPWHMIYTWGFYDVSEFAYVEEGGGFGFGRFRARYHHANANNDCWWRDYSFPLDSWQNDPPLPVENWEPDSICIPLAGIDDGLIPDEFFLSNNYPNPFNPETWIPFQLADDTNVRITIFEIGGNIVRNIDIGYMLAGSYVDRHRAVYWNGRSDLGEQVSSGIYFVQLKTSQSL